MSKLLPASELIALGSLFLKPAAGYRYSSYDHSGCALGKGDYALREEHPAECVTGAICQLPTYLEERHKWMTDVPFSCPCECYPQLHGLPAVNVIAHLFDRHVMRMEGENGWRYSQWTFAQLLDWVRENEPKMEEENATEHAEENVCTAIV
jgi:hypothetical protein